MTVCNELYVFYLLEKYKRIEYSRQAWRYKWGNHKP